PSTSQCPFHRNCSSISSLGGGLHFFSKPRPNVWLPGYLVELCRCRGGLQNVASVKGSGGVLTVGSRRQWPPLMQGHVADALLVCCRPTPVARGYFAANV